VSTSPPRYPVEIVRRLAPPAPAKIGGRVVELGSDGVRVLDVTGTVYVETPAPLPPLGAWVTAKGTWNGKRIEKGRCRLLNVPLHAEGRGPFPDPHGEWAWYQNDGARRIELLRRRATILKSIREFLDQRAFTEVETPLMVPSPGLEVHLDAFAIAIDRPPARFLITSPEYQMKRLLAGGLPRIYQICKCFRRNEEGPQHQPEFSMLEWYRSFASSVEIMRDTEALVAHVAAAIHSGSTVIPGYASPVDVAPPWDRITVAEAFQRYAGVDSRALIANPDEFFRVLVDRVQPQLGRLRPVFLTHWPVQLASLARVDPKDPTVADRFEAFVDGVELSNGFGELIDPTEQRRRFEYDVNARRAMGKPVYPVDERFLFALEEGLPPCGGNALGIDRLVMLVLGVPLIDDVVAFSNRRL
jgi:lysyl-tRNA synthetase class 2